MVLDSLISKIKTPFSLKVLIFAVGIYTFRDGTLLIITHLLDNDKDIVAMYYSIIGFSVVIVIGIGAYFVCSKIYKKYVKDPKSD